MKSKAKIAIIGGTGLKDIPGFATVRPRWVLTKYGWLKVKVKDNVIFLLRHGFDYKAPHRINARANIMALKQLKAEYIIASAACGSLKTEIKPGDFAVLTDFVDFTKSRLSTFEPRRSPNFIDMSQPYSELLNNKICQAGGKIGIKVHDRAVYACAEGPRFETKAEIKVFGQLGCDLVGMTQIPEVVLAAEAGIPYAAVGIVTNYAAGISQKQISSDEVGEVMKEKAATLSKLLLETIKAL